MVRWLIRTHLNILYIAQPQFTENHEQSEIERVLTAIYREITEMQRVIRKNTENSLKQKVNSKRNSTRAHSKTNQEIAATQRKLAAKY